MTVLFAVVLLATGYSLGYVAGMRYAERSWSNLFDRLIALIEKHSAPDDADWWKGRDE